MPRSLNGTLGPMELQPLTQASTRDREPVGGPTPTDPDRRGDWRALVSKSLGRAGLSQKAAAADLGVTESAFSKQLGGAEHLSFWRMGSLPPAFWRELILLIVEFHDITVGATQQDAEDAAVGRLVREVVNRCR